MDQAKREKAAPPPVVPEASEETLSQATGVVAEAKVVPPPDVRLVPEGTAPRPHWLTIRLPWLSLLITVLALLLAVFALRENTAATRRGQQAYVSLSAPQFLYHDDGEDARGEHREQRIVYLALTLNVENAGNTPATIFDVSVEWSLRALEDLLPPGTTVDPRVMVPLSIGELRPGGSKQGSYQLRLSKDGQELTLPRHVAQQIQAQLRTGGIELSGQVAYKTVFSDDMQYARGCWKTMSGTSPLAECPVDPEQVHKSLSR